MKKTLKRILSAALCVLIAMSASTAVAFASEIPQTEEIGFYQGVYYYRPSTSELDAAADAYDVYTYSDNDFLQSGRVYSDSLATTSMSLAVASVSSTREPFTAEGYARKSRNVIAFLEDCGFSDITVNEDYRIKPTKDTLGVVCAHKTITDGGVSYPLLAVIPRSAGYEKEWGNNFVLGASGDAKGFNDGAEKCLAFAKEYLAEHRISGDIKVWIAGYSRGAAVANLAGKKLIDAPSRYLGDTITLDSENLYDYTFGTPSAAAKENNPRDPKYAGIFNTFSLTEISSAMAPADMGFERYGTDRIIEDDENYELMLQYLSVCSPAIYNDYITQSGPKQFHAKKLSVTGENIGIVNDDDSYIPNDITEYLKGLCTYMTQIGGGREMYAEKYEKSLSGLLGYYMSLTGEDSDAFLSALLENEDTYYLIAALYAYFMNSKLTVNINANKEKALQVAKELVSVAASEDTAESGIEAKVIAKVAAKLLLYLTKSPDELRSIAADYLTAVMPPAMDASGAAKEEIALFSDKAEMESLAHMVSFLMLGNIWQSDKVEPLNINNEQIKNAATLIGNFDNYLYDHYNEIIISRLKVEDSRYEVAPVTDSQRLGYRRVYVSASDLCGVNGTILDNEGNAVGVVTDGVLTQSNDNWVGFTRTDDGGFFRIPSGADYQMMLEMPEDKQLQVKIGEYACYDAQTEIALSEDVTAPRFNTVEIILPAFSEGAAIPSGAEYQVNVIPPSGILGDADGDGKVTVIDALAIQKHLASIAVLSEKQLLFSDVDQDGVITVMDATAIQKYLASVSCPQGIGEPITI